MSSITVWDNVMKAALSMPLVKIDRNTYLRKEFRNYGDSDKLATTRPIDVFDEEIIERVAKGAINSHLTGVTLISAAAGIPGKFAMLGTIPADLAQYYWHIFQLAQKLAYIYGWSDLLNEKNEVDERTRQVLTLFVGVMSGAQAATSALRVVSQQAAAQVGKKVANQTLTKTAWYPIVKKVAGWIGVKITKQTTGRAISKAVPILGAITSGGLTYAMFRPMAKRLQNELREQMRLNKEGYESFGETEIYDIS